MMNLMFALLFTLNGHATKSRLDFVDLTFTLESEDAVISFVNAATDVPTMSPRSGEEGKINDVQLRDPQCVVNAIHSFDMAKYAVLDVRAMINGKNERGRFVPLDPPRVTLVLEVGNLKTPYYEQVWNMAYGQPVHFISRSPLHKTTEYVNCPLAAPQPVSS